MASYRTYTSVCLSHDCLSYPHEQQQIQKSEDFFLFVCFLFPSFVVQEL